MHFTFAKLRTILGSALCVCSLGAAGCLCAALFSVYDPYLHHFPSGNPLACAAVIAALLGAALSLILCIFVRTQKLPLSPSYTLPAVFAGTLIGFLLLACFILTISSADTWLQRIQLALMALAACRFLLAAQSSAAQSPAAALLSLAPILYAFFSVLTVYFEKTMPMNSPMKSWHLMAYIAAALFFTAEARSTLGRTQPAVYCLFAGLCTVITGTVGLSHIVAASRSNVLPLSLWDAAALTAIAAFAATRLFSLQNTPAEEPAKKTEEAKP